MPKQQETSHWENLAEQQSKPEPLAPMVPTQLTVRLTHGTWFGVAMGIGFAIGFLISFLCLVGFVGFVVYSKFPGLFS